MFFPMHFEDSRIVHCQDAVLWLESSPILTGCSLVTSLPDFSEFPGLSLNEWKVWFIKVAALILSRCPNEGIVIFYQTDIKVEGTWIDKGFLCQKAGELSGHELLWHKIVCRAPAGNITYGRPSYSHLLCFSQGQRINQQLLQKSIADVIPDGGKKTWQRGMGLKTCLLIAKSIGEQTATRIIVNPFCGQGSMLAAANFLGMKAIGIERSPKQAKSANCLKISADGKRWLM